MTAIPERMKGVVLTGHGGFEMLEWREDIAVPKPGAGEVLIRVAAAGVNNTDINTRIAWYSKSVTGGTKADEAAAGISEAKAEDSGWTGGGLVFPRIQGADVCGRIVAVGDGVEVARIGQRVIVEPVIRDRDANGNVAIRYLGSECDGGFAEFACVPDTSAYKIECELSDVELGAVPCAFSTAENLLTRTGLRRGETVLVTGASGGVGSSAVQLAKRREARVIAVASPAKADEVRALGADRTIARDDDPATVLGSESVDVVIDLVGGPQWPRLLEALKRFGRYGASGAIAGAVVPLDLRTLYLKDLTLSGCTVLDPHVFPALVGYLERGEIRPPVAKTYPLREIVKAQEEFLSKKHAGKIVLEV